MVERRDGQLRIGVLSPLIAGSYMSAVLSAISDTVMQARGYRTVTDATELQRLGFAPGQCRVPGLLLPLHTTDGSQSVFVYRPDNPRVVEDKK